MPSEHQGCPRFGRINNAGLWVNRGKRAFSRGCCRFPPIRPAHRTFLNSAALVHDWVEVGTGCKLRYIPDMAALTQSHRNSNPFLQASAPTLIGWRRRFRLPHWRCRCRLLNSLRAAPLEVRVTAGHCLRFCNESALSFRFSLSEVGHATHRAVARRPNFPGSGRCRRQ